VRVKSLLQLDGIIKNLVAEKVGNVNNQVLSRALRGANALRNAELEVLKGQRSGKVYKKAGGGYYTASAAGEPPARRTGNLRLNWTVAFDYTGGGTTDIDSVLSIESNTKYAGYLEHGTRYMKPRPFKDKIIEKATPEIKKIYSEPYT